MVDRTALKSNFACAVFQKPHQGFKRGGFAHAIATQKADRLAGKDLKREILHN
jgi:hypothetical protein